MRIPQTFDDVVSILKDLQNFKDRWSSRDLDLTQRRITNVHPSVNDYDVVVRKELQLPTVETQSSLREVVAVFWSTGDLEVGEDICPPFIFGRNERHLLYYAFASLQVAPAGSSIKIKAYRNGDYICNNQIEIPAGKGKDETIEFYDFISPKPIFTRKDRLDIEVTQVGSSIAGSKLNLSFVTKIL